MNLGDFRVWDLNTQCLLMYLKKCGVFGITGRQSMIAGLVVSNATNSSIKAGSFEININYHNWMLLKLYHKIDVSLNNTIQLSDHY